MALAGAKILRFESRNRWYLQWNSGLSANRRLSAKHEEIDLCGMIVVEQVPRLALLTFSSI